MRLILTALLCLGLAACGGTTAPVVVIPTPPSGPTDPTPPTTGGIETAAQMRSGANGLLNSFADPVVFTPIDDLPNVMTATYDGYAYGTLANTDDGVTDSLLGNLSLTVSLTATSAAISGSIDNIVNADDETLGGSLTLSGGSFDRDGDPQTDSTLRATFSGLLTDGAQSLDVGGQLQGDFLANNHAAVGGQLLGSVIVSGFDQDINGGFIAER